MLNSFLSVRVGFPLCPLPYLHDHLDNSQQLSEFQFNVCLYLLITYGHYLCGQSEVTRGLCCRRCPNLQLALLVGAVFNPLAVVCCWWTHIRSCLPLPHHMPSCCPISLSANVVEIYIAVLRWPRVTCSCVGEWFMVVLLLKSHDFYYSLLQTGHRPEEERLGEK